MRIVVAPDSFKGSASATEVTNAIADGWRTVWPGDRVVTIPMADGGEGSIAAVRHHRLDASEVEVTVPGPVLDPVTGRYLATPDRAALIEMAEFCGLPLVNPPAPMHANTLGLGAAIRHAVSHGARRLDVALGGSASTDGGTGALTALGVRFLDHDGAPVAPGGRGLLAIRAVDTAKAIRPPDGGVRLLSDVTSPLLGPDGAARLYGPQKGAGPREVARLEAGLAHLATLLDIDPSSAGAGAAGGTGYGLMWWGGTRVDGAAAIAELVGLSDAIAGADLVITGEGCFDAQTPHGKLVGYVSSLAARQGVPCVLIAGAIRHDATGFADRIALSDLATDERQSMSEARRLAALAAGIVAGRLPR